MNKWLVDFAKSHKIFLSISLFQLICSIVYITVLDLTGVIDFSSPKLSLVPPIFVRMTFAFIFFYLCFVLVFNFFAARRQQAADQLQKTSFLTVSDVFSSLFVSAVLCVNLFCFAVVKSLIQYVSLFPWDDFFRKTDLFLHLNAYPHDLLYGLLDRDHCLQTIELFYWLWFAVMYGALIFTLYKTPSKLSRHHFVVAFSLIWFLVGNVFATIFSSAGPIFYDFFHGPIHSYVSAFDYLKVHNSATMSFYDVFIEYLRDDNLVDPNGPSAVPSVHVAIAAIIFFYFNQYGDRTMKVLSAMFLGVIMVGSVYLLWHYAVDAYISLFLAWCIWRMSQYLLYKFQPELI